MIRRYKNFSETFLPKVNTDRQAEARSKGIFVFNDNEWYKLKNGNEARIVLTCHAHKPPTWYCSVYIRTKIYASSPFFEFKLTMSNNEVQLFSTKTKDILDFWPEGLEFIDLKLLSQRIAKEMINDLDVSGYYGVEGVPQMQKHNVLSTQQKFEKSDLLVDNIFKVISKLQS